MPRTNLIEAIVGRENLKWDAIWHLFEWLMDEREGHELGHKVVEAFCLHVFGQSAPSKFKREYQLSTVKDGKGKWADFALAIPSLTSPTTTSHIAVMDDVDRRSPRGRRKLENLKQYRKLARLEFPSAIVRLVVLTNARDENSKSIRALYVEEALGMEADS